MKTKPRIFLLALSPLILFSGSFIMFGDELGFEHKGTIEIMDAFGYGHSKKYVNEYATRRKW